MTLWRQLHTAGCSASQPRARQSQVPPPMNRANELPAPSDAVPSFV